LLIETLPGYLSGAITPQPQDDALATLAPRIQKEEGLIDWSASAAQIERTVRAFTPWPGTWTTWNGKQLKIHAGTLIDGQAEPGRVVEQRGTVAIGTGDGLYAPARVQLEGRGIVTIAEFARGYADFVCARLGE
jgi:methionyl-tRNA formyltransferase